MTIFLLCCLALAAGILWLRRHNPAVLFAAFLIGIMSLGQLAKVGWIWVSGG